ncbi:hypothetical protein BKA83DRAFT_4120028 [Pisolithus microcarpus]|nr:hypothetical protein BKA83DRAFT_4120028 [Pisolithus microcarpus]
MFLLRTSTSVAELMLARLSGLDVRNLHELYYRVDSEKRDHVGFVGVTVGEPRSLGRRSLRGRMGTDAISPWYAEQPTLGSGGVTAQLLGHLYQSEGFWSPEPANGGYPVEISEQICVWIRSQPSDPETEGNGVRKHCPPYSRDCQAARPLENGLSFVSDIHCPIRFLKVFLETAMASAQGNAINFMVTGNSPSMFSPKGGQARPRR